METFDYLIIGLGIALIAIGLFLFISGKRDSQKSNQVEGFGIKLNVSNPSIILIVFGIGMVLFPRLMPNSPVQQLTEQVIQNTDGELSGIDLGAKPSNEDSIPPAQSTTSQAQMPARQPQTMSVFFPQGAWYLTQYQENGIDLTSNIKGNINFSNRNNSSRDWHAEMAAVDGWGNLVNYYYSGVITATSTGYKIDTQSSNDPTFVRQAPNQLVLKMDNLNSLHMEYVFNGVTIMMHWSQN